MARDALEAAKWIASADQAALELHVKHDPDKFREVAAWAVAMSVSLNAAAPSVQPGDWVLVPRKPTEAMFNASGWRTDGNRLMVQKMWRTMLGAAPAPSVVQSEREACPLCERDAASRPNSDEREGDDQRLLGLTKADPSALAWLKQLKVWAYWHYNERAAALYATHQARASAGSATVDARAATVGAGWVNCPICGESDMRKTREKDCEGDEGYISCVNLACASNGGTNATALLTAHTHSAPPAQEIVDAIQGLLDHACIADAAPEDVDEEDRARERKARALITRLTT